MNRVIEIDFGVVAGFYTLDAAPETRPAPNVMACPDCGGQAFAIINQVPVCLRCALCRPE